MSKKVLSPRLQKNSKMTDGIDSVFLIPCGTSPLEPSYMPGGSDAFRKVLREFCKDSDEGQKMLDKNSLNSRHADSSDSDSEEEAHRTNNGNSSRCASRTCGKCADKKKNGSARVVKTTHSKKPQHVQWADEGCDVKPLAFEPCQEDRHSARIYKKTVPKPILKHRANCVVIVHES